MTEEITAEVAETEAQPAPAPERDFEKEARAAGWVPEQEFKGERKPAAIVYRHYDGMDLDNDVSEFFADVERATTDTRYGDPSYLAAKFVCWQMTQYAKGNRALLATLGVGIVQQDPGDIEYRCIVMCKDSSLRPDIKLEKVLQEVR